MPTFHVPGISFIYRIMAIISTIKHCIVSCGGCSNDKLQFSSIILLILLFVVIRRVPTGFPSTMGQEREGMIKPFQNQGVFHISVEMQ